MKKSKIARWIAAAGTGLAFLFALIIPMGGVYSDRRAAVKRDG